ncbi:sensor domain-containing protein [Mycolicibacterium sp. XJ1819]
MKVGITRALAALVVATSVLTGCVNTTAGNAVRGQDAGPIDVAPLDRSELDDVLLSVGEINGIMGATTMKVTSEFEEMTDHSADVSDPDCLGAIYAAEEPVYAGSGWTAMRDQVIREPDEDNDHWVEQTAVLYPSADKARAFFEGSRSSWKGCAGDTVAVDDGDTRSSWTFEDVTAEQNMIAQYSGQEDAGGWGCQHALAVVSNVTVETWACGFAIEDEAATIAADMVANAARR